MQFRTGSDVGYPNVKNDVVDGEWKHRRLSRCKVHGVGTSNPWLADFGKRAYISPSFHARKVKAKVSHYCLGRIWSEVKKEDLATQVVMSPHTRPTELWNTLLQQASSRYRGSNYTAKGLKEQP
eukprot:scaffold1347_cov350-Pavlova_lutheri.AAC.39